MKRHDVAARAGGRGRRPTVSFRHTVRIRVGIDGGVAVVAPIGGFLLFDVDPLKVQFVRPLGVQPRVLPGDEIYLIHSRNFLPLIRRLI